MRETIETQHLDEVTFGIYDEGADQFLIEPDDIESFITNNKPTVVAKAIVDSTQCAFDELKGAIRKELIDCYERQE